jgi:tripartite-type tricarboxylate transporter receptor subunit TctC
LIEIKRTDRRAYTMLPRVIGGPAAIDLLGGQVQVYFGTMASSIEYIKAGKLRPLAVTSAKRVEVLPDITTAGAPDETLVEEESSLPAGVSP